MKKILQILAKITQYSLPLYFMPGLLLSPARMVDYLPSSLKFWFCLGLGITAVLSGTFCLFGWRELDWNYSCFQAITEHSVFQDVRQFDYRPSTKLFLAGVAISVAGWLWQAIAPYLFCFVIAPLGVFNAIILLIIGVLYLPIWWNLRQNQESEICYMVQALAPRSVSAEYIQEQCKLKDLHWRILQTRTDMILSVTFRPPY